jgi:hypothetical protein
MNGKQHLAVRLGLIVGGALSAALTGCVTDDEQPRSDAYYTSSGEPDAAYAEIQDESDFYEPLGSYGRWEIVGAYGRCWIPDRVDADWSPYANGYWRRTDAGWYWESDEPWGWATYHYGRWDLSLQFGWYWVPQTQWAPSWVYWRQGGGYVGWAPLRPSARFDRSGAMEVQQTDISARGYVFVEERRFLEPVRPRTVIVNDTIINQTTNITKIRVVNRNVINEGPNTVAIERVSGQRVQAVPVRDLRRNAEARVGIKHSAPAATSAKPIPAPVHREAQTIHPAPEPRQVARPATAPMPPQPPVARKEVNPADEQKRKADLAHEKRVQPEKTRAAEVPKRQTPSPAVAAKPRLTPEATPKVTRETAPKVTPETKQKIKPNSEPAAKPLDQHQTKPVMKPRDQRVDKPEAKVEPAPATERPTGDRQANEQKPGKEDEKKD